MAESLLLIPPAYICISWWRMDISVLVVSRSTSSGHLLLMSLPIDPTCTRYKALLMFGLLLDPWEEWAYLGCLLLLDRGSGNTGWCIPLGDRGWGTLLLCCSSSAGVSNQFALLFHIPLFSFGCFLCYFYGSQLCLVGRNRQKWNYIILSCYMFMYIFVYSYVFPTLL